METMTAEELSRKLHVRCFECDGEGYVSVYGQGLRCDVCGGVGRIPARVKLRTVIEGVSISAEIVEVRGDYPSCLELRLMLARGPSPGSWWWLETGTHVEGPGPTGFQWQIEPDDLKRIKKLLSEEAQR